MATFQTDHPGHGDEESALPFVAPCRTLDSGAPFRWLKLGWDDLRESRGLSLVYGAIMTLITLVIVAAAYRVGSITMAIAMMAGFVFLFPALAMGVYSVSCQLERREHLRFLHCLRQGRRHLGNAMIFAFFLLIVFLVWARASSVSHIFYPERGAQDLLHLLIFFAAAVVIVLVFSALVFAASAFSLPMIMDRRVDAITAIITSFNAVMSNKAVMLEWMSVIVAGVLFGFATGFIGLIVVLPLLGHATWHGYRETIIANDWPQREDTRLIMFD